MAWFGFLPIPGRNLCIWLKTALTSTDVLSMILGRWWSNRSLYTKGAVVVAVPLLAMLVLVPVYLLALRTASARADDERRAFVASQAAQAILKDLLDAETGVRGFLLTEQPEFLEPYREALDRLPGDRVALERAIAADGDTQLRQLDVLARKRLTLLARFVHDPSRATEAALETGRRYMDQIRVIAGRLSSRADDARVVADHERGAAERRAQAAALIVVPLAIGAGAIALTLFANGIVVRVRRNTRNAERLARGEDLLEAPEGNDEIGRSGVALVDAARHLRDRERALRRSEGEMRAILDSLREGVAMLDADGVVVRVNPAGDEISGMRMRMEDEAAWHERYELAGEEGRPLDLDELPSRRAARGLATPPTTLHLLDRELGVEKWLTTYGAPVLDEDGTILGGVVVVSDVTERVRADGELRAARDDLERTNAELREAQARLEAMAVTDALTGLLNRHGFEPLARQQLELARRGGADVSLLFFDLDGLKLVNDRLGHHVGSQLLAEAAEAITTSVRAADLCVRLGGDEFCVLMTGETGAIDEVLARVEAKVAEANARAEVPYAIAMSVGSATSTAGAPKSLEQLLEEADARMYEHKRSRRSERANA